MQRQALFILLFGFFSLIHAQTEVEGDVDGHWTLEGSPYIAVDDITVEDGSELTIDPGVEVRFDGLHYFFIRGLLTAVGAEEDSILFTGNDEEEHWRGIRINNGNDDTEISYAIIEFAQTEGEFDDEIARGAGISCWNCDALFTHNTLRFNVSAGRTAGIYTDNCDADILSNHLHDNVANTNGTLECVNSRGTISHNLVERNESQHGGGMLFYEGAPLVEHNIIRHNLSTVMRWGCGLYFAHGCEATARFNLIADNEGGGVYAGDGSAIENFTNNTIAFNTPGRCAVLVFGSAINMTNCIIWGHNDSVWLHAGGRMSARFCDIQNFDIENLQDGEGCIDENPLFSDVREEDYHLDFESPCIDAGDPDSPEDADGSRADVGCYGPGIPFDIIAEPEEFDLGLVGWGGEIDLTFNLTYRTNWDEAPDLTLSLSTTEEWLRVAEDEAVIEPNENLEFDGSIVIPENMELEEHEAQFVAATVFEERELPVCRIPVSIFVIEGAGVLTGRVSDAMDDSALQGITAQILDTRFQSVTDEQGVYRFEDLPASEYRLIVESDSFHTFISDQIAVEPDQETVLDIGLHYSLCNINLDEIECSLKPDSSASFQLVLSNPGSGSLEFTIEKSFDVGGDLEPWESRSTIDAGEITDDDRLQGVEYVEDQFYVSGGNNGEGAGLVHRFNRDGELIGSFDQFHDSRWGMRDLAYDGELLWGGDLNRLFGFSLDGELIREIPGMQGLNRALTYDPERELLWIMDTDSRLLGYDREGRMFDDVPGVEHISEFGLATYIDDPDECRIYSIGYDADRTVFIHKVEPERGEWREVGALEFEEGYLPGGCCITNNWDPLSFVFMTVERGPDLLRDKVEVFQLTRSTQWFEIDITEGSIEPGARQTIEITLNSAGLPVDLELEGSLNIDHNGRGERIEIPVRLNTIEPDNIDCRNEIETPDEFRLFTPYPNPFNDSIKVSYSLAKADRVALRIFDLQGGEIATVFSESQSQGLHQTEISGKDLVSGTYLISLENSVERKLKKVVLLK